MPRLRKLTHMCSSTLSDPANRLRKTRKKKSSAVPLFRSGHMSAICARLGSKGKVGVQRGRKTAGCPSFLPPRRAPRRSRRPQTANPPPAEVQRKTLRPERANPPAAVRVPRLSGAEKEPPGKGEHANAVRAPRLSGAEKEPPVRGEHANAVRVPRWVGAENPGNPEKIFPPEKAAKTPVLTLRNGYPNGIVSKT